MPREIDRLADELNGIFTTCEENEKAIFATFLLTGLREEELC